jgi:hypothetical protein
MKLESLVPGRTNRTRRMIVKTASQQGYVCWFRNDGSIELHGPTTFTLPTLTQAAAWAKDQTRDRD